MAADTFVLFKLFKISLIGLTGILMMILTGQAVSAQQGPMVTFRLDDGLIGQYNYARPILGKYNFPATAYIFTNPPEEGNWTGYMNWSQIRELHNVYGWEIGGHTKSHPDLTKLTNLQLVKELSESKKILENQGFTVKSFASPFGLYNNKVLSFIAKFYESHNSAWPYGFNSYPFSDYEILVQEVRNSTSVATIKNWIDEAASNQKWLVLLFHEIVNSNPTEYQYSKDNFELVVDYLKAKDIPVVTTTEALKILNPNLVLNPSFESATMGWADNWLRTNAAYITLDTNNNGSSPNPKNSLKIIGSINKNSAYTKDFIEINPNKKYLLKSYFNCQNFSRGGVDVFIDEYDSNGNRLNWKRQTGIQSKYVGYKTAIYSPSQNAANLLIWIEVAAGSSLTCYVDNIVLAETEETSAPSAPSEPDTGNRSPNLVPNPSFESATSSWADNWLRTNTAYITLDTNNNGYSPNSKNSLKFIGGSNTLRAYTKDFIEISPNKTFFLETYFNCQNFNRGGIDVFIDEYDAAGKWVSWRWQTGIWTSYVGLKTAAYTPSPNVAKILIWIESASGSNLTCYIDNIVLEEKL